MIGRKWVNMSLVAKKFVLRVTSAWTANGAGSAPEGSKRERESWHDAVVFFLTDPLIHSRSSERQRVNLSMTEFVNSGWRTAQKNPDMFKYVHKLKQVSYTTDAITGIRLNIDDSSNIQVWEYYSSNINTC